MSPAMIAALVMMGGLGILLGAVIGIFARFFHVKGDPRIELVAELLPGANCGGCGHAGCVELARAIVKGEVSPGRCPVSSQEQINAIAMALGIDAGRCERQHAVVLCGGDHDQVRRLAAYNGVFDCASALLVAGGALGCRYGCIGMGSCAHKCPFGAIEIVNGLAVVHTELCVGCGQCVAACPRGVIRLVPESATCHIYCNSPEKGSEKRKHCKVGCIGCGKCEKTSPGKYTAFGAARRVDYEAQNLPDAADVERTGCPVSALLSEERHLDIETHDPEYAPHE